MPDLSRRTQLRESTSEAHAALDRLVGSFDSLESYRRYLRGMSAFRQAVECQLASASAQAPLAEWSAERFSGLIADDLQDLAAAPVMPLEVPKAAGDAAERLGILYVLEGSALGSRVLYKRAQSLGLCAEFGARHLAVQSRRSDRWPAFLALLEKTEGIDMQRVAQASRATFQAAERAFRQVSHEPA